MKSDKPEKDYNVKFWSKVRKTDGCWLWQGQNAPGATPTFRVPGAYIKANRYAYAYAHGPLDKDVVLMRTGCQEALCVNPAHYSPSTREDAFAQLRASRQVAQDSQCRNGHPRTEANTMLNQDGSRRCRICNVEAGRRFITQRREGTLPMENHEPLARRLLAQLVEARQDKAFTNPLRLAVYFQPSRGRFLFDDRALTPGLIDHLFSRQQLVYEGPIIHQGEDMLSYGPA